MDDKFNNESEITLGPEMKEYPNIRLHSSWCYIFVHHSKTRIISEKLKEEYNIFIHKNIVYQRNKKRVKQEEHLTIPGLIFIQGECEVIQTFLKNHFEGIYLVRDCLTKKTAVIKNDIMHSFMQISKLDPTRIRFMPHTFEYYSMGNALIRITSGILSGVEGYRIRIARDKCLITSIGGMTIAIGGIHKENFENVDEYIEQQRKRLNKNYPSGHVQLTPLQLEIDKCFFVPQTRLDVMMIVQRLSTWISKIKSFLRENSFYNVAEVSLFLLEEIGSYFRSAYYNTQLGNLGEIITLCQEVGSALISLQNSSDVTADLKEVVIAERESLAVRFPFLPLHH